MSRASNAKRKQRKKRTRKQHDHQRPLSGPLSFLGWVHDGRPCKVVPVAGAAMSPAALSALLEHPVRRDQLVCGVGWSTSPDALLGPFDTYEAAFDAAFVEFGVTRFEPL